MSTPQESITTVNGRRCTRSRARTAAPAVTSEAPQVAQVAQVEATEPAPIITPEAEAPPPASEPPPAQETTSAAPAPSATPQAAAAQPALNIGALPPAAEAPNPAAVVDELDGVETEAATSPPLTIAPSAAATSTASPDPSNAAAISVSSVSPTASQPPVLVESSLETTPEQPEQSPQSPRPGEEPGLPTSEISPGGPDGMIGPDQSSDDAAPGLTISAGTTNVGGIVGGVVGGFAGIVLISVLLFLCLRRRRSREPFVRWKKRVSEEKEGEPGFLAKLRAVPADLKTIPAAVGVFLKNLKAKKPDPPQNPYNRQSVRSSVSSVYSVRANRRSQSMSEPPSRFREQLRGFGDRMPSLKRSRTLLQRKQDSLVIGGQSPFPGIVEDPVTRNSKGLENPFADPEKLEPSALQPSERRPTEGASKSQRNLDGLRDQQRAPISPKPVALSNDRSRDPFSSILDELEERKGSSTPLWLRETAHKRTQSATTALNSHPPSTYTASIYTTADNPFLDPSDMPPVPQQSLPPNPPRRPLDAYTAGLPTFNATSSAASRDSAGSFFFGEPGPSRPTTNMFSEVSAVSAVPRVGRQSDPFDLDRPEVLGFGHVSGRQVRASVTRQSSKTNRMSSVPNWVNVDDGPYERASAVPGPLKNQGGKG